MVKIIPAVILFLTIYICATITNRNEQELEEHFSVSYADVDTSVLQYRQQVYVPVNARPNRKKSFIKNATTVLKIRNTSLSDSLYVFKVHYFDTEGQRIKNFVDSALLVKPMATTEIVVRNRDFDSIGDNFIVEWRSGNPVQPLIQVVGTNGQDVSLLNERGILIEDNTVY